MTAINTYDEYGVPGASNAGTFQYTGQMWLSRAGLYNYRARAYAQHLGVFAQTDPIGQADNANLYAYVGADPINNLDPLGLNCVAGSDVGTNGEDCSQIVIVGSPKVPRSFCESVPFSQFCGSIVSDLSSVFTGGFSGGSGGDKNSGTSQLCPAGPRLNIGLGYGGTVFLGTRGASGGVTANISIPLSVWKTGLAGVSLSLNGTAAGLMGRGAFAAMGPNGVGGVSGADPRGLNPSSSDVIQGGAAWNAGGELAVQFHNNNIVPSGGSLNVGARGGYGAYIAAGRQGSATLSTGPLFCKASGN